MRSFYGVERTLLPSMNNLFRGIPFFQKDKVYKHIQASQLVGKRAEGNPACCFHSFYRLWKEVFFRKSSIWTGRKGPLKPSELLHPIGYVENKPTQFSISLIWYSGSSIFQTPDLFINSPGVKEAFHSRRINYIKQGITGAPKNAMHVLTGHDASFTGFWRLMILSLSKILN